MTTSDETRAREQAQAQLDGIRALVQRFEHSVSGHSMVACELAEECEHCAGDGCEQCNHEGATWNASAFDGLDFYTYHDSDDAQQAIYDDPLSVEVRSGWASVGAELTAEEYQILLCTGGPAVRIMGELDEYGSPTRTWIEYQDWFTPWQEYHADHDSATLLTYSAQFLG